MPGPRPETEIEVMENFRTGEVANIMNIAPILWMRKLRLNHVSVSGRECEVRFTHLGPASNHLNTCKDSAAPRALLSLPRPNRCLGREQGWGGVMGGLWSFLLEGFSLIPNSGGHLTRGLGEFVSGRTGKRQ